MANTKDIKFFFCGDPGKYDEYHPQYVYERSMIPRIVSILSGVSGKGVSIGELAGELEVSIQKTEEAIEALERVNAIKIDGERVYVNFTIFTGKDQEKILKWSSKVAPQIGQEILKLKDKIIDRASQLKAANSVPIDEILYHIIGCYTLDWKGLEVFSEEDIIINDKPQPGERNYVLLGMEETEEFDEFTRKLFCSSQNISAGRYFFSSFGDQTGQRVSAFPGLFWSVDSSIRRGIDKEYIVESYNDIARDYQQDMAAKCGQILVDLAMNQDKTLSKFSPDQKKYIRLLLDMGYLEIRGEELTLKVPVFLPEDLPIIKEISNIVIDAIIDDVREIFEKLPEQLPQLTSIKQNINPKEMLNEVWHQVFARINLILIDEGLMKEPMKREGEGYYLKTLYYLPDEGKLI